MSLSTVKTVAARFLKSDKSEVLALKGAWGVGKTHAWNKLILECKNDIKLPNYCYVSLFGISSISELRTAIFTKTRSVKLLGTKLDAETVNNEWSGIVAAQTKKLFQFGSGIIKELPYGKNITVGLETLAPHFIRKTIVCFDDFERLSSSNGSIKAEDVLGQISELKEEKGCKVVLIFNEEKLASKEVYSKYREKVVDIELLYDPTPNEAAEIALPANLPCRSSVKKHCVILGVKNIRVLRKIVTLVEMMHEIAGKHHPKVMEQAVHTLILLAWCYFDAEGKKPTLEFIRQWNQFAWSFEKINGQDVDPTTAAWNKQLQSYDLTHLDEFDLTLFKVIECGYLEETGFEAAASDLNDQYHALDLEQSFTAAWDLFHNTFADNQAELEQALHDSFKKSVKHISPLNLNGTTNLLRQLGRADIADELIDFYLDVRANDEGILDLDEHPFSGDIRDPAIWEKFAKRKAEKQSTISLGAAVQHIAEHGSWSRVHLEALKAASKNDYYDLFKQDHGQNLSKIVGSCLQFESWEEHKTIGQEARAALIHIGKENQLNAIRVRRHKITIEELDSHDNQDSAEGPSASSSSKNS